MGRRKRSTLISQSDDEFLDCTCSWTCSISKLTQYLTCNSRVERMVVLEDHFNNIILMENRGDHNEGDLFRTPESSCPSADTLWFIDRQGRLAHPVTETRNYERGRWQSGCAGLVVVTSWPRIAWFSSLSLSSGSLTTTGHRREARDA